jgi:tRNA(Ile)-lysidine synthase
VDEAGLIRSADSAFDRLLAGASGILIALSGGADSVALTALLAAWAERTEEPPPLHAATVDHGLRAQSALEAARCAEQARALGLPHRILRWDGPKPASGLQEAARNARYALLAAHARSIGASHVVTAHHADDQAETVLMRLCAGSGIGGLAAMRETSHREGVTHVRPLLAIRKAALAAFCAGRGLAAIDDPSNADPRFARARMRGLADVLQAEGLTPERLVRLAGRAARADEALTAAGRACFDAALLAQTGCVLRLDWRMVAQRPAEIRLRVLAEAFGRASPVDAPVRLDGLESLLDDVDDAAAGARRLRRTLGGRMATLMAGGVLAVSTAPARRIGDGAVRSPRPRPGTRGSS